MSNRLAAPAPRGRPARRRSGQAARNGV